MDFNVTVLIGISGEPEYCRLGQSSHFIDDLEETFLEEGFPPTVQGILYAPAVDHSQAIEKLMIATDWKEITQYFFPLC